MVIYPVSMLYIHEYIPYIHAVYPWIYTLIYGIHLIFKVILNTLENLSHCSCDVPELAASGSLRVPPESPGPGEGPAALGW